MQDFCAVCGSDDLSEGRAVMIHPVHVAIVDTFCVPCYEKIDTFMEYLFHELQPEAAAEIHAAFEALPANPSAN